MTSIVNVKYLCLILIVGVFGTGDAEDALRHGPADVNVVLSGNGLENQTDSQDHIRLGISENPLLVTLNEAHDLDIHRENEDGNRTKTVAQREAVHFENPSSPGPEDNFLLFQPPDVQFIEKAIDRIEDRMCRDHVRLTLEGLNRRDRWAMKMLDSSAKFPEGMLSGNMYLLGNFDECISIRLNGEHLAVPRIQGKYCVLDVMPNGNLVTAKTSSPFPRNEHNSTIHWAVCVPHSCQTKDIEYVLHLILNSAIGSPYDVSVKLRENMCHVDKPKAYNTLELVYGYVIIGFCSLIFLATFYHVIIYYNRRENKMPSGTLVEIVLTFSLIRNIASFLKVGPPNDLNLTCICGIKIVSMLFIISGHALVFMIGGPVVNEDFFRNAIQKLQNTIFLNNPLLVDTFLLVSGFLMCRLILIELEKRKGKINFLALYIFRYIRLTPAYLVVIGFYCTWFIRMNEGPLWNSRISEERDRCLKSWWANILYINNYVNIDKLCMFQSWYLSVDTQLFMIAPLVVYPLWRWRKIGQGLLMIVTTVSIIIPFVVTYMRKLDPTLMFFAPEIQDLSTNWYFVNVYMKTHMRASSYCFGLVFGYIVHRIQSSNYKISRTVVVSGWILGMACIVSSMCSVIIFYDPNYEYDVLEASIYAALHRSVWCLGVGWVMLACITNNAGPVQKFLCWKPFVPLSRLTYCAYLVNGLVELHDSATMRHSNYMSVYHLSNNVFAHSLITLSVAFILCIFFESPIHGFERILLKKDKERRKETTQPSA